MVVLKVVLKVVSMVWLRVAQLVADSVALKVIE
jgi:hypothetical protein